MTTSSAVLSIVNDPSKAGQIAGRKEFFGQPGQPQNRFAIYPIHTRFNAVSWIVTDAELIDELTGFASIIRQEPSKALAMNGLRSVPILTKPGTDKWC